MPLSVEEVTLITPLLEYADVFAETVIVKSLFPFPLVLFTLAQLAFDETFHDELLVTEKVYVFDGVPVAIDVGHTSNVAVACQTAYNVAGLFTA
jgi:hypothetical protein